MANEYMMVSSVTNVLNQATDWLIDLGESWIDSKLPENLFKEVPIIKMLILAEIMEMTYKGKLCRLSFKDLQYSRCTYCSLVHPVFRFI